MVRVYNEYEIQTAEEYLATKVRYDNTIDRVRETAAYFEEAEDLVQAKDVAEVIQKEWELYLACDPVPNPFEPQEIRKYFFKTMYFKEEDIEKTTNWLLGVDERSILTQDIDAPDLTRENLAKFRPNFGKGYEKYVSDTMEILHRIQEFLKRPTRLLKPRTLKEVEEMRYISFEQIHLYIDKLTYRVLSSENAYMEELDATSLEYFYAGDFFDVHLWTFRDVPIYLDPAVTPFHVVSLTQVQIDMELPFSVLHNNLVVRGLHTHFDHFSDHVRFFKMPGTKSVDKKLTTKLRTEWLEQLQLQDVAKKTLLRQYEEYEESVRIKAEEDEIRAKKKKAAEEKSGKASDPKKDKDKNKKPLKAPQKYVPGTYPNVHNDFLLIDKQNYEETIRPADPALFNLNEGEINLRKYQILGGIYQLNFIIKPRATNFPTLILAWYDKERSVKFEQVTTKMDEDPDKDSSKFFKITFNLPESYCHWGEPIACHYEEGLTYRKSRTKDTMQWDKNLLKVSSPVIISDFNLHELFNTNHMHQFIENTIPRVISSFQLPNDQFGDEDAKKGKGVGRRNLTEAEMKKEKQLQMQKQMLSFNTQNRPERLFPLFKKTLPVIILPAMKDTRDDETKADKEAKKLTELTAHNAAEPHPKPHNVPYDNFSDFFTAVDAIKEQYRATTFYDILGQPIKIIAEDYEHSLRASKLIATKSDTFSLTSKKSLIQYPAARNTIVKSATQDIKPLKSQSNIQLNPRETSRMSVNLARRRRSTKIPIKDIRKSIGLMAAQPFATRWSTTNILKTEFNANEGKYTIWTDRLGTFAFAYYRYQHFPFQNWSIQPNKENPDEVVVLIESMYAAFRFYVSSKGYRVAATDFTKYEKSRKVYYAVDEPTTELEVIKSKMQQAFLNIFPEKDFAFYVTGYFNEKHAAAEYHAYKCMSLYATSLKFLASVWNKLSDRRIMVLRFGELQDNEDNLFHVRITPEDVLFVEIQEICDDDLDKVNLKYTPTWRNLEPYLDLNHLITANFNEAEDMRLKDPYVLFYLNELLQTIRPLSCS